ncbi:hypothetical protein [Paenibacillus sp. FSL R10-2771]|uniref:hypothetical protein n=1 Tax=Paenibacillus sp. FSL R10-2771 TaxID=2954693 RepID=UPI0030F72F95
MIEIDGRKYRASNYQIDGSGHRIADVEYYHQDRGWRTVRNWDRIEQVAAALWPDFGWTQRNYSKQYDGQMEWEWDTPAPKEGE